MFTKALPLLALLVLTACGGGSGGGSAGSGPSISSRFATPDADGDFDIGLTSFERIRFSSDGVEGVAYVLGQTAQGDLVAAVGLLPGTDTQFWPGTGTATYSGVYTMGLISPTSPGSGDYQTDRVGGALTLTADFANDRLTGQSIDVQNGTIPDFTLGIDADMSGRFMDGTVTITLDVQTPIIGVLDGRAGNDQAFGVFHASGDDFALAGGFNATRQ